MNKILHIKQLLALFVSIISFLLLGIFFNSYAQVGQPCSAATQCAGTTHCLPDYRDGNPGVPSSGRTCGCINDLPEYAGSNSGARAYVPLVGVDECNKADGFADRLVNTAPTGGEYILDDEPFYAGDVLYPKMLSFFNAESGENVIHNMPVWVRSDNGKLDKITFSNNSEAISIPSGVNTVRISYYNNNDLANYLRDQGQSYWQNYTNYNSCYGGPESYGVYTIVIPNIRDFKGGNPGQCEFRQVNNQLLCQRRIPNLCGTNDRYEDCPILNCCGGTLEAPRLSSPGAKSPANPIPIVPSPEVRLEWESLTEEQWGLCPGDASYRVFWRNKQLPNGQKNCNRNAGGWQNANIPISQAEVESPSNPLTRYKIPATLIPDNDYCWYVQSNKGSESRANSEIWEFKVVADPYFMGIRGDMYIADKVAERLRKGVSNGLEIGDSSIINQNTRLENVSASIIGSEPYFVENLFSTQRDTANYATLYNGSEINAIVQNNFIDQSYLEYTSPIENSELDQSLYQYYLNQILSNSNIDKSELLLDSSFSYSGSDLRDYFGVNINSNKLAIIIRKNNDNFDVTINRSSPIICNSRTLFFIEGNLNINTEIYNSSLRNSSCLFFVEGKVTINLNEMNNPPNYRVIESTFIANEYEIESSDDRGTIAVHGSIITHNSSDNPNNNLHNIETKQFNKPQDLYVFDPRTLMIWADELQGNLSKPTVREERFITLIKERDNF